MTTHLKLTIFAAMLLFSVHGWCITRLGERIQVLEEKVALAEVVAKDKGYFLEELIIKAENRCNRAKDVEQLQTALLLLIKEVEEIQGKLKKD